jgi:hypothetical protein
MSTQPVTNPSQVTTAILAQELYEAFVSALAPQNAAIVKAAAPGQSVTLLVPSLTAIQLVQALAGAGLIPTSAQLAAQVGTYTYIPVAATPAAPPYTLGAEVAPGLYVLTSDGSFPNIGATISVNGVNYEVIALTPFEFGAQVIQ